MDNSLENIIELGKKFLEQKGIINPRSEALLIVQNALNKSKLEILTNSKEKIPVEKKTIIKNKFFERSTGKPVSKIFGKKEFYSNNFFVNINEDFMKYKFSDIDLCKLKPNYNELMKEKTHAKY